jgi:Zn finger protein HypA/HybF involved in hydrogenase expression
VSLGIILGMLLSSGHWAGAKTFRKFTGKSKTHRIACANCGEKYTTDDFDAACPKCNEPPHEVSSHTRTV